MKIDIEIKDNRKFAEVAFLVDREDFQADIKEVRKTIELSKFPYVFPTYPYEEANKLAGFYKKGQISVSGTREMLEEFCREKGLLNLYALDKVLGAAVIFAKSLIKKYNKNRLYIPIVLASILTARIQEEDFRSTQMFEINHKVIQEELALLGKNEEIVTISVNRESTAKEVQRTFDFIQKYYFKTKKTKDNDGLNNIYEDTYGGKLADTIPNIKRDREWYWLKKDKLSYAKIVNLEKQKGITISPEGVKKAIDRYKSHLK